MNPIQQIAIAAIVAAGLAVPVAAQQQQQNYSQVTQADIERLQDSVFQAGSDVQQLKSRDAARAGQLQSQLDDLREEVIYLKVKLRKEGSLPRSEYAGVRDRLDALRSQVTNTRPVIRPPAVRLVRVVRTVRAVRLVRRRQRRPRRPSTCRRAPRWTCG